LTVQHTLGYFLSTMTQAILGGFWILDWR
jgi:hypothetical protein